MKTNNRLVVETKTLQGITALAPLVAKIARVDGSLADQVKRAASSIALNLGEGLASTKGTRRARLENALGSQRETMTALEVALAWGYLTRDEVLPAQQALDDVGALLYRLGRAG